MKKLLVLMLILVFGIANAGAADFTITGSYFARGTWVDNWTGKEIDSVNAKNQYGVYDHEMSLDATWQISPESKVFSRIEIRDEDWAVSSNPTESVAPTETDDNIYIEHLWGQHTFTDSRFTVRAGLMKAATWATSFSDENEEAYRLLFVKGLNIGKLIAVIEKLQTTTIDLPPAAGGPIAIPSETLGEDSDIDTYSLSFVTRLKGVTLMPLVKYFDAELLDQQVWLLGSGFVGAFDTFGFEAEINFLDFNDEDNRLDYTTLGAYANVWAMIKGVKAGALIAYGSYDEDVDKGFEFGDDFDGGGAMLLGDEVLMHDNGQNFLPGMAAAGKISYNDLQCATLLAVYLSYPMNEKLTLGAYLGYADSNVSDPDNSANNRKWDGASAWEVNITGEYKISDNVAYSFGAATAQIEYGDNTPDPDKAVEIYHKMTFNF